MSKKSLYKFETIGIFFTFFIGLFLRHSYNITSGAPWTLIFGSVNSSIWEEIKIFAIPFFAWRIITFAFNKPPFKSFFTASILALYIIILGQILSFCLLKGILGNRNTLIELSISLFFLCIGSYLCFQLESNNAIRSWFYVGVFGYILFLTTYIVFTATPFKIDLFLDELTNSYGIPLNYYKADYILDYIYFG